VLRFALIPICCVSLAGCEQSAGGMAIPEVSGDARLQRAYESCVGDNVNEMRNSEPELDEHLPRATLERIWYSCETGVVRTCERDQSTDECQAVLEMYLRLN